MAGFINNSAVGGMTKELLWSNSSPSRKYSSGSATIAAADYDLFLIKYKFYYSDSYYHYSIMGKGQGALVQADGDDNGAYRDERLVTITDTKITFSQGTYVGCGYDGVDDGGYLVPIALYGLK